VNVYQVALAVFAAVVVVVTWNLPRSVFWISLGALSFIASTAWARYDFPMEPFFTAVCDAAVCLAIFFLAQLKWELMLFRLFQASVLISLTYYGLTVFWPSVASHYVYVTLLEIINWLALLLIFGTGIIQSAGVHGDAAISGWDRSVRWAERTLLAPRTSHPFPDD
jgi:hypothetical protein